MKHVNCEYSNAMRGLFCVLLLAIPCSAQITSISSSGDGGELRFTSNYVLKNEPDGPAQSRIYRYAPDVPEVLARGNDQTILVQPLLSADGSTSGYTTFTPCTGSCMLWFPRTGVVLDRNGHRVELNGRTGFHLSRNGRWLLEEGFPYLSAAMSDLDRNIVMINVPVLAPLNSRNGVSDAGAVVGLVPGTQDVKIWSPGSEPRLLFTGNSVTQTGISPDGKVVLIAVDNRLIRIDPATGDQQVAIAADQPIRFSMDTTGTRAAVLIGRDLALWGPEMKLLYTSPEDVTQIEMSDDASTVFVLTARNRVTRIDVATAQAQELYPPFVGATRLTSYGPVPGSALRFSANGFDEQHVFTSAGFTFPIAKLAPDEFQVQIPWDFPTTGQQSFHITTPASPFQVTGTLHVDDKLRPWILTVPFYAGAIAAQQDFSSTVTQHNPAPGGSTIHLWLTGLGPLDRPLKTGEVGPADPPARPLTPFACYLRPLAGGGAVGLRLPFVAYAPGLLGLYQVDATIPDNWPSGKSNITCTTGTYGDYSADIWTQ